MAGRKGKVITKDLVENALKKTKSLRAAARYLGMDWRTLRPYTKIFIDDATGKSFHELYMNKTGKGIPKRIKGSKQIAIKAILNGELDPSHFSTEKIKQALIFESYIPECCNKCGMSERRVTDYKIPLLLNFLNKNKRDFRLENLELLCYNCYFLYVSNVFTHAEETAIEDFSDAHRHKVVVPTFELDDYYLENMKAMGIKI